MQIVRFPFANFDRAEEAPPPLAIVPEEPASAEAFIPLPQQIALTQEELEAKEKAAFEKGFAEGVQQGITEGKGIHAALEAQLAELLQQLNILIASLENPYQEAAESFRTAVKELSGAVAFKLAGRALQEKPEEAVLAMLEGLLPNLIKKPELRIEVHPELVDRLQEKIIRLSSEQSFSGRLDVVASAEVPVGDCRVEWANGKAVLNQAALQEKVKELLGL